MKNNQKSVIAVLLIALLTPILSGCVAAVAAGATAGTLTAADRRTVGAHTEDEGIEWKMASALANKFGDQVHLNRTSYNRKVLITGEVPNEQTKYDVERQVRAVNGVLDVYNEMQVGPTTSIQTRTNDVYITSKVKGRFVEADKFYANMVKVVTEAGAVYLLGIVTHTEANLAIEIARTTSGVTKVVNLMEIVTPQQAKALDIPRSTSGNNTMNFAPDKY